MDDRRLVKRCIRGGEAPWRELIALHGEPVRRAIQRTLARGGRAGVEETNDVFQGLLISLLEEGRRRLKTFRGECSLQGWLAAVATRFTLDHLRKRKVRRTVPLPELECGGTEERDEEADRVREAIDELSSIDAMVLRMFHIQGLSYRVISRTTGIPMNTLCSRIARARTRLRKIVLH